MSNRVSVKLSVGGPYPSAVLEGDDEDGDLLDFIDDSDLRPDWGAGRPKWTPQYLFRLVGEQKDKLLVLYGEEVSYEDARVMELVRYLQKHQVPYDLTWGGDDDGVTSLEYYRPATGVVTDNGDGSGEPYTLDKDLRPICALLRKGLGVAALHALEDLLGPEVEPLQPFEEAREPGAGPRPADQGGEPS